MNTTRKRVKASAINHVEKPWIFFGFYHFETVGFKNSRIRPSTPLPHGNALLQLLQRFDAGKLMLVIGIDHEYAIAEQAFEQGNTDRTQRGFKFVIGSDPTQVQPTCTNLFIHPRLSI